MGCGASTEQDSNQPQDEEQDPELEEQNNELYDNMEKKAKDENDGDLFNVEEEDNEKFMAVRPWIGALVEPSQAPEANLDGPDRYLRLQYVNGYRCEDSRQNLFYSASGEAVFMSAALGIVHDIQNNTQTYFGDGLINKAVGHNDDIESIHVNGSRTLAATGQRGKNPHIFVWDINTKEVIGQWKQGRNTRAARCIRFTKDDQFVAACDISDNHVVRIWDTTGAKQGECKTGNDMVYDMSTSDGQYIAAVATKRGIKFIQWAPGTPAKCERSLGCQEWTVSCQFNGSTLLAGTTKGSIYLFSGRQATKNFKIQRGGIHAICVNEGKVITSGYSDHTIKVWGENNFQQPEQEIPLSDATYARSMDVQGNKLLVGTRDGQIFEYELGSGQDPTVVMSGHGTGEAWGLALSPDGNNVVTSGDDNKVINFDVKNFKHVAHGSVNEKKGRKYRIGGASTLSSHPPNQCSRAVEIHPTLGHIVVATNEGEISVRTSKDDLSGFVINTTDIDRQDRKNQSWIEVLKFSPDGQYLAVGTHSRNIIILSTGQGEYKKHSICKTHNSAVLAVDWTTDSSALRSVCQAYELLFHNIDGQHLTSGASQFKDEQFASQTCKLGWWVQGIFPPATDGTHVNGVARSNDQSLIATGDDWGLVNLYRNPNVKGSKSNSFRAHSSHVVRVVFSPDDQFVYSIGGYDRCLMVWRVTDGYEGPNAD